MIRRARDIGEGVGQRAVEIENDQTISNAKASLRTELSSKLEFRQGAVKITAGKG